MQEWQTLDDVERDLFEYSQMEYPGKDFTTAPPKSIAEYRARTFQKPGLFDEQPEAKEIFISGRGKHHPGVIIRPGMPVNSTPEDDLDIRKKIREVSGLGYGNELTERIYGKKETSSSDEEDSDLGSGLPDLKLKAGKQKSVHEKKTDSALYKVLKSSSEKSHMSSADKAQKSSPIKASKFPSEKTKISSPIKASKSSYLKTPKESPVKTLEGKNKICWNTLVESEEKEIEGKTAEKVDKESENVN